MNAPLGIEVMSLPDRSLYQAQRCQSGQPTNNRCNTNREVRLPSPVNPPLGIEVMSLFERSLRHNECDLNANHNFSPFIPFPAEGWLHTHGNRLDQSRSTSRKAGRTIGGVEVEDEEVKEVVINGKIYYTSNETNGTIYDVDENGDISLEVGVFVNGRPKFN